jgi:hypothetical protein
MIRWDPLPFWSMDLTAAKVREVMNMIVPKPMAVAMAAPSAQFEPSRDRDPYAEAD